MGRVKQIKLKKPHKPLKNTEKATGKTSAAKRRKRKLKLNRKLKKTGLKVATTVKKEDVKEKTPKTPKVILKPSVDFKAAATKIETTDHKTKKKELKKKADVLKELTAKVRALEKESKADTENKITKKKNKKGKAKPIAPKGLGKSM